MKIALSLILAALAFGGALSAQEAQQIAAQEQTAPLSADEQAFAAKLSDQNRRSFSSKFSVEQRQAVMAAVQNGAQADEAVHRMLSAKEIKGMIADADEAE